MNQVISTIHELREPDILITPEESAYKISLHCNREEEIRSQLEAWWRHYPCEIPRKIHQVWIGPHRPPWKWIDSFQKEFTAVHPGWEYILWREPEIAQLELFNRVHYEQEHDFAGRTDILRYEILYRFGGVYIDADAQWLNQKSFDDLLLRTNLSGLFAGREDERMIANGVIGCSPRNPLMYYVIRLLGLTFPYTRWKCGHPNWIASGPLFLSEAVLPFGITEFPREYFYPVSWRQDLTGIDTGAFPDSYMIQYGYSSNQLHRHIY